mgnify:CR=1 FL=1
MAMEHLLSCFNWVAPGDEKNGAEMDGKFCLYPYSPMTFTSTRLSRRPSNSP